ncbi:PQQ-like beta-propeller repeat protein, partial [Akkermansiaceae bacterium]|nr:PQQ-like beta-propeller repeat protein [Akkermansiaceae bacterium]
PTPVSDGKMVYSVSDGGVLVAMVAATGEKKWEQKLMGNFYASPLLIGGKLYCLSREGEMIVAEVGEAYREIARSQFDLGGSQWADATPAVAHQQLYVRVGARIDCFSSAK